MSAALGHNPDPDDGESRVREAMELYDRYVKPLEDIHRGEFAAVFADGRLIVGSSMFNVVQEATTKYGRGSVIFHVGDRVISK